MSRQDPGSMRRRLNAIPKLGEDYDEKLSQYLHANSRRFRIAVPAGEWWVAYEHPGYLAWYGAPGADSIAAGIGVVEAPHAVVFEIEEDVIDEVDLATRLTGDLEEDAALYQATVRTFMIAHADLIGRVFGKQWVPVRHAWGILAKA